MTVRTWKKTKFNNRYVKTEIKMHYRESKHKHTIIEIQTENWNKKGIEFESIIKSKNLKA